MLGNWGLHQGASVDGCDPSKGGGGHVPVLGKYHCLLLLYTWYQYAVGVYTPPSLMQQGAMLFGVWCVGDHRMSSHFGKRDREAVSTRYDT